MIHHHINQGQRPLKVMSPNFEGFENGKQFLVVDIKVEFGKGKGLRVKSDWVGSIVGWRYGGKDGGKGVVQSVHSNNQQRAGNPVS